MGDEVRKEHHGLTDFCKLLGIQLRNHDGQRYRNHDAENDEDEIVSQRISQHAFKIAGLEKELEVAKTVPAAVDKEAVQEVLAGSNLIIHKGNDYTEHGRVAENQIPDGCGKM